MGDIEFWLVFVIENSIKLQKMVFKGKHLLGNHFTLGLTTLVYYAYWIIQATFHKPRSLNVTSIRKYAHL